MITPVTFYELLGVPREASGAQLKKAYLEAARRAHPDVPGGDRAQMAQLNEAWAVLSDPDQRRRYDRSLVVQQRRTAAAASPQPSWDEAPPEIDDDGAPLSTPLRWLTRLAPLLFASGIVSATVGLLLQVRAIWLFGVAAVVGAGVLFVLMPFFAMSARR